MDIIDLIKRREEKGLSLLYDKYAAALLGIIVGIVKDKRLGEEVLQTTMLKIWSNIDQYDPDKGNFFSWIAAIARSKSIDQTRLKSHQKASSTVDLDKIDDQAKAPKSLASLDTSELLASLSGQHRIILEMVYLQGYTQRDTAQILEIPLGTVKTRIRKAISILRDGLAKEKNLFLGMLLIILLLIIVRWI